MALDEKESFDQYHLDDRLRRAITKVKYGVPTTIQAQAIPLIKDGKDLLARAKTGSGKTAAYLVPIIDALLAHEVTGTSCLILVPTKELGDQVFKTTTQLCQFASKQVRCLNLATTAAEVSQRQLLLEMPQMVIATPAKALLHIKSQALSVETLKYLVVDEADLIMSYGHEDDMSALAKILPRSIQTIMMSATLDSSIDTMKDMLCREPVILKIEEKDEVNPLLQYYVTCAEEEKFLLTYVILKLKLIKGKIIVFVNEIDRCYRLKLFLEQFGIKSCVLNNELPVNSRAHIVDEFNRGVYDIIIASDDTEVIGAVESEDDQPKKDSKKRKRRSDKEFGVSRGVDFRNVACVLNFDLPTTRRSYVHRVGRTARAGKSGMSMSFVVPAELYGKHKATSIASSKKDERVLARITKDQEERGNELKVYKFNMEQVDAFRYRMTDALRAVTKISIRDARAKEIRAEILASEKLKTYFEERPDELVALRHDAELHSKRVQPHLKHVPDYLLPNQATQDVGFVGFKGTQGNRIRKNRAHNRTKQGRATGNKRSKRSDPLNTFK